MDEIVLTDAEKKLIDAAAKGEIAVFLTGDKDQDDPAKGAGWGPERTIRADVICRLATSSEPNWPLHWRGVQIFGARITGEIDLDGARLETRLGLIECHIEENVGLRGTTLDALNLRGSHLSSLFADRMTVKGSVFLRDGFHATGQVQLVGANIGGNLACRNGRFENAKGNALSADGATVKGSIFLRDGFHATGQVRLVGANIGGDLAWRNGRFENAEGDALTVNGATVKGSIFLRKGFHATGPVRLAGVDIGGDLDCSNGKFENDSGDQLVLERAKIAGALNWTEVTPAGKGGVNFHLASAGSLIDDSASWPAKGHLVLDGFTYESIGGHAPTDWRVRKDWLDRQWVEEGKFRPQPYEQLVKVLRAMGHDRDARQIAIEKQRALRRSGMLNRGARAWHWLLDFAFRHGYQVQRGAIAGLVLFFLLGSCGSYLAAKNGIMVPAKERVYMAATYPPLPLDYPVFEPLIYSLDVLLPIVDLHQESYWLPSANKPYGTLARIYMWVHIALGWILTTLAVAGFTGLVKKD